jgi:hypothetical protein
MRRLVLLSTAVFLSPGLAYAGSGPSCAHYAGHASVEGKWGSERSITETAAFVPLACREDRLLYGDVRLKADNRGNREGNVGLGVRALKENGVAGGYVYLDRRRSGATEKLFTQTTLGAEWLAEDWEVRSNAYVPLSGKKQMGTSGGEALSDPYLAGSGIYVDVAGQNAIVEKPLWGVDAEAGLKLPGKNFWVHAGGFAFDASEAQRLAGGRLRATYNVTDNIALTAEGQYDSVRGRQGWLGVRLSVPFGGPKIKPEGLKRRMTADPVRDVDIVTAAVEEEVAPAYSAPVENTGTGVAQRVLHVDNSAGGGGDGTIENPFNTLAAAQAAMQDHDVIYINRGTGTTAGMNAGLAVARNNVWVIGSGTDFVYDAGRFYAPVEENLSGTVLVAGGLAPVITNAGVNGDGISVTGADTYIGGVTVNAAARHGIYALSSAGTNLGGITVQDVTVTGNTQNGILIESGNAGSSFNTASIRNVTATGNTGAGIYTLAQGAGALNTVNFQDNITSNNTSHGISLQTLTGGDIGDVTLGDITSQNNTGANIRGLMIESDGAGSTISSIAIEDSVFNSNTDMGIYALVENAGFLGTLTGSVLETSANAGRGIYVLAQSGGDVDNINLDDILAQNNTGINGRGIHVTASGAGSVIASASVMNSTISGNASQGILASTTSGGALNNFTLEDTTVSASTERGVYISAAAGSTIGTVDIDGLTSQNHTSGVGRGLEISTVGAGAVIDTVNVENSSFTGNAAQGVYVVGTTDSLLNSANFIDVTASGNSNTGLFVTLSTGTDVGEINLDNVTAENNLGATVRGIQISTTNAGSTIGDVTITNSTASGNTDRGAYVSAGTGSTVGTLAIDNFISHHSVGSHGLEVSVAGAGAVLTNARISNTEFYNNSTGAYVRIESNGLLDSLELTDVNAYTNSGRGILVHALTGADIQNVEVDDLTAQSNTVRGLDISSQNAGSNIANITIENSLIENNASAGINIDASTAGTMGTVFVSGITANTNPSRGIQIIASNAGSSITTATVEDSTFNGNTGDGGLYISATGAGLVSSATVSNVQITNNTNRGLYAIVTTGGDIGTLNIDNVTSTNNTAVNGRGIQIQASDAGSTITTATVTNSTVTGNASLGMYGVTLSGGVISSMSASNVTASSNVSGGIAIDAQSAGAITNATLSDIAASNNGARGVQIIAQGDGDIGTAVIENVTAQNNTSINGNGAHVYVTAAGSMIGSVTIRDSLLSGNDQAGIYIQASATGILSGVNIYDNTSTGNTINGIFLDDDTTNAYVVDLGGGALGGTGNNRIFGNTGVELRIDLDGGEVKAENNWWGVGTGLAGGEVTLEGGSTVDSTPFLAADPGP